MLYPLGSPLFTAWDSNGQPLSGGKLYCYEAGTTTAKATYADASGASANTFPVVLNARGEAKVFFSGNAKFVLKDASDVEIWTADYIGGNGVAEVSSMDGLRALGVPAGLVSINLLGYYAPGDGGGGQFYWDEASTATDNGGTIILPTGYTGTGRWLRNYSGAVNVRWFGAKGDGVADDTLTIQGAINVLVASSQSGIVQFPYGIYRITSTLQCVSGTAGVMLSGTSSANYPDKTGAAIMADFIGDAIKFPCPAGSDMFSRSVGADGVYVFKNGAAGGNGVIVQNAVGLHLRMTVYNFENNYIFENTVSNGYTQDCVLDITSLNPSAANVIFRQNGGDLPFQDNDIRLQCTMQADTVKGLVIPSGYFTNNRLALHFIGGTTYEAIAIETSVQNGANSGDLFFEGHCAVQCITSSAASFSVYGACHLHNNNSYIVDRSTAATIGRGFWTDNVRQGQMLKGGTPAVTPINAIKKTSYGLCAPADRVQMGRADLGGEYGWLDDGTNNCPLLLSVASANTVNVLVAGAQDSTTPDSYFVNLRVEKNGKVVTRKNPDHGGNPGLYVVKDDSTATPIQWSSQYDITNSQWWLRYANGTDDYLFAATLPTGRHQHFSTAAEGTGVLYLGNAPNTKYYSTFFAVDGTGASTTDTALLIQKHSVSDRSINAAGTINASGADYAEYERNNGKTFEKGAIVGFLPDGTLTDQFDQAIRFAVKSTAPAYVGGDTWSSGIGPRPEMPERQDDESDDAWAARLSAYELELSDFTSRMEAARANVDRIAYAGKVPVNVSARAGEYIIATRTTDGGITGLAVPAEAVTFATYRLAVGRVNRVLDDGRAEIAVIIH